MFAQVSLVSRKRSASALFVLTKKGPPTMVTIVKGLITLLRILITQFSALITLLITRKSLLVTGVERFNLNAPLRLLKASVDFARIPLQFWPPCRSHSLESGNKISQSISNLRNNPLNPKP